jgi:primosomal protein N' (replication factor Y)
MQNYKILLPKNFDEPFDYFSELSLEIGDFVSVPFRSSEEIGVVWGNEKAEIDSAKIKKVISKLPIPPLTQKFIKFLEWVAEYNMAPLGNILRMALSVKFTSKPTKIPEQKINYIHTELFAAQQAAADTLRKKTINKFSANVLDGVTGSGKTEVYFEAIDEALSKGKQVLVLLPEIGLSHQWLLRFQQRFGIEPGIWHSDRTPKQRREVWLGVAENKCRLVVGARSALFLPFQNLGLIIVDEEHDGSYKQEEGVIYHGRDMAVMRASIEHIPVVLVSATPSIETVQNIREDKYELIHLPERYGGAVLPKIEIIDMKREKLRPDHFIANKLRELLAENIQNKQQSILFLNRRGYAPLTLCRACGHRIQCPHCSAWLVLHKSGNRMQCHHCGFQSAVPKDCPSCHEKDKLHACGPGVERLYEEVLEYFPDAKVEIMASDSPKAAEEIVQRMINHDIDILIGTQMIAKGHHFPKLQLVGIVDADLGLEGGDLRAMERSYQILHQVAGRAGREQEEGRVIIQTYNPQNLVMQALINGERDEFVENELLARRRFEMPPFGRLATIMVSGKDEREVKKYITALSLNAPKSQDIHLLGPAPAPMSFLRGQWRYRLILRSGKKFQMQKFIKAVLANTPAPRQLKVKIDIDPFSFV